MPRGLNTRRYGEICLISGGLPFPLDHTLGIQISISFQIGFRSLRAERELEKRKRKRRETVFIRTRNRSFMLGKDSILYVESRGKKVELHIVGESIEAYAFMNELETQLGEGFYRCHRCQLEGKQVENKKSESLL